MARVWRLELPIEKLRAAFRYDPETGDLINRYSRPPAMVGQVAGYKTGRYIGVTFEYEHYLAHRVVWALHHDTVPEHLDHRDGNGHFNRIENLRECTQTKNNRNMKPRKSRSKFKGVTAWQQKGYLLWRARIVVDKKEISLGYFKTEEEAAAAYIDAANARFGAFARTD